MKNKSIVVYVLLIIPLLAFCRNQNSSMNRTGYIIEAIDSTTFKNYYWIIVKNEKGKFNILSEKEFMLKNDTVEPIQIGLTYSLTLESMNSIKENGANVRIGNGGYYIDGKLILEKGNYFYLTPCMKGILIIKSC